MALILLISLLFFSWELTTWFVLQPMDWVNSIHWPNWLILTLLGLFIAWCLGD